MSDEIDRAQELEQRHRDAAIRNALQRPRGAAHCEVCGVAITELRQLYGARECIPHAEQREARERMMRRPV